MGRYDGDCGGGLDRGDIVTIFLGWWMVVDGGCGVSEVRYYSQPVRIACGEE